MTGYDIPVGYILIAAGVAWLLLSVVVACYLGPLLQRVSEREADWEAQCAADHGEPTRDVIDAQALPLSQSETACRIRALMLGSQVERYLRDGGGAA